MDIVSFITDGRAIAIQDGTNAPPSPAGLLAKAALEGRGWR